jgi:uncharacterized protein
MLLNVELGLQRTIHDPIHGTIRLSNLEMDIVEHPLFRRLHNVRQNSFLYNVFPSAKHTRFEHSIGVMHLAGKMFEALLENGDIADKSGDIADLSNINELLERTEGVGINLYKLFEDDISKLNLAFKQLRVAALLHDIGHGPLSHLFDSYAPTVEEFLNILNTDEQNEILLAIKKLLEDYAQEKNSETNQIRIEHEHVSIYFTYRILKNLSKKHSEIDDKFIKNVLTILNPELSLGEIIVGEYNVIKLLNDIVASAPIDCDRMDYLKRDSYFAGVPYGNYSEERVLKSFLPYVNKDKEIRLGIKESGLHAVENFLLARYELYVQVYGHKTNEACNAMLDDLKGDNLPFSTWAKEYSENVEKFEQLYIDLSDEFFMKKLLSKVDETRRKTLERIIKRDLWKRVFEIEEFVESDKESEGSEEKKIFDDCYENLKSEFGDDIVKKYIGRRYPFKDLQKGAKLLEKVKESVYIVSSKNLSNASQITASLKKGLVVRRIYTPLNEKKEIEKLKEYVRKFVNER